MSIKNKSSSKLQAAYKTYFWVGVAAFVAGLVQLAMYVTMVTTIANVSWFFFGQLVPAAVFGVFFIALGKNEIWQRLYQATLATIVASLLMSAVYTASFTWLPAPFWPQSMELGMLWWNLAPFVIWFVVTVGLLIVIKKQSNAKNLTHLLQQILVLSVGFWFLITVAQTAYMVAQQLPENPNLSGHMPSFYGFGIMLLLFLPAFVMEKRRGSKHSVMVSVLTGVLGGFALLALSSVMELVTRLGGLMDSVASQWGTTAILTICVLIIALGYPWAYRRTRSLVE